MSKYLIANREYTISKDIKNDTIEIMCIDNETLQKYECLIDSKIHSTYKMIDNVHTLYIFLNDCFGEKTSIDDCFEICEAEKSIILYAEIKAKYKHESYEFVLKEKEISNEERMEMKIEKMDKQMKKEMKKEMEELNQKMKKEMEELNQKMKKEMEESNQKIIDQLSFDLILPLNQKIIDQLNKIINNKEELSKKDIEKMIDESSINVALASNGGIASALDNQYLKNFEVSSINNGDRMGKNWKNGGGWLGKIPDSNESWVQIDFEKSKHIDRVIVYTLQDDYTNAIEPTNTLKFTKNGVTDFQIQGWNGTSWQKLGVEVIGNNLVKRTVNFMIFETNKIRVSMTGGLGGGLRIVEVEAWTPYII